MINEIETILKKLNTLPSDEGGICVERMHPTDINKVNDFLKAHLTELLQKVNHDHEILVNTILDTHKAQLQSLIVEIDKEIDIDEEISATKDVTLQWANGWNTALNLTQEKIKKLIK